MLGRSTAAVPTVATLRSRAQGWALRLTAAVIAARFIQQLVHALESSRPHSAGTWVVVGLLLAVGFSIPVAILVFDHERGVHVREDGIRSVSASGSSFLAWPEIAGFDVRPYWIGSVAVYATRPDGARVPLGDTARWAHLGGDVEHTRDELVSYRERLATPPAPRPAR